MAPFSPSQTTRYYCRQHLQRSLFTVGRGPWALSKSWKTLGLTLSIANMQANFLRSWRAKNAAQTTTRRMRIPILIIRWPQLISVANTINKSMRSKLLNCPPHSNSRRRLLFGNSVASATKNISDKFLLYVSHLSFRKDMAGTINVNNLRLIQSHSISNTRKHRVICLRGSDATRISLNSRKTTSNRRRTATIA